ncbi:hypothetical protein KR018_010500, partial [Drosophila ironensis]
IMAGTGIWSRSTICKAKNNEGAILPAFARPEPIPDQPEERPCMSWILGWEYGRKWLQRREEIHEQRHLISSLGKIPPDFGWWLNQRRPFLVRQQRFRSKADIRKPITAFGLAKQRRENHKRELDKMQ